MKKLLLTSCAVALFAAPTYATTPQTPLVSYWQSDSYSTIDDAQVNKLVTENIPNVKQYSNVKVKKYDNYIVVTGFYKNKRLIKTFKINFDNNYNFVSLQKNYMPSLQQAENNLSNSMNTILAVKPIPQEKILVIIASPAKFWPIATQASTEIYKQALKKYKASDIVFLYGDGEPVHDEKFPGPIQAASLENVKYYLTSPNIKGVFYDGDSDNTSMTTSDNMLNATDLEAMQNQGSLHLNQAAFIAIACNAFQPPLGQDMVEKFGAKLFMAGLSLLGAPTSDYHGAQTFIRYVINGENFDNAYTEAQTDTMKTYKIAAGDYTTYDEQAGIWGIAGNKTEINNHFPKVTINSAKITEFNYDPKQKDKVNFTYTFPSIVSGNNVDMYGMLYADVPDPELSPDDVYMTSTKSPATATMPLDDLDYLQVYALNKFTGTPVSAAQGNYKYQSVSKTPVPVKTPWWVEYYGNN